MGLLEITLISDVLPVNFGQSSNPDQKWNQESSCFTATRLSHTNDVTVL